MLLARRIRVGALAIAVAALALVPAASAVHADDHDDQQDMLALASLVATSDQYVFDIGGIEDSISEGLSDGLGAGTGGQGLGEGIATAIGGTAINTAIANNVQVGVAASLGQSIGVGGPVISIGNISVTPIVQLAVDFQSVLQELDTVQQALSDLPPTEE